MAAGRCVEQTIGEMANGQLTPDGVGQLHDVALELEPAAIEYRGGLGEFDLRVGVFFRGLSVGDLKTLGQKGFESIESSVCNSQTSGGDR